MDTRELHAYRLAAVAVVATGFFTSLYLPGWRAWAAIGMLAAALIATCVYSVLIHKRNTQYKDARRFAGAFLDDAVQLKRRFAMMNGQDEKKQWCEAVEGYVCAAWGAHWFLTFEVNNDAGPEDRVNRIVQGLNYSLRISHELPVEPDFEWKSRPEWWQYFPAHKYLMRKWTTKQKLGVHE